MEPHKTASGDALPVQETPEALPRFFSVTQYNRSVDRLVRREVPKVWVQGTITQINVRGRVAYLTLAEFEANDAKPKAAIDVFLWSSELEALNARFASLALPFALKAMLKVALQLEPGFYVPTGRFQPHVTDVDPRFTVGELALTRQKILAALRKEGLIERNKALPLNQCPLRIGLISAEGSAAYQDFTTVLLGSGFAFQILFVGARMQGDNTEASVITGLRRLAALKPDCICIVRGGGARTDLVYFDSEAICRAIANCPVPVLTGIGHEIDRSLADEVAHADLITPTDCAKFLEERLQEAYGNLLIRGQNLKRNWQRTLEQAKYALSTLAKGVRHSFETAKARERAKSETIVLRMQQATRFHFGEASLHLSRNIIGLKRGPAKLLAAASANLEIKSRWLRTVDPAFVMRLGYALVRNGKGEAVKGAAMVASGETISLQWHDGTATAQVLNSKEKT
jgi:exodeoxyribonuclease VII large subunit